MNVTIPTLQTERLILRGPRMSDMQTYVDYKMSERSKFTGGPIDREKAAFQFASLAGLWALRGYGLFMAALKDTPDTVIGGFGIFHPLVDQEEPEFGWTVYDATLEGKGYVTEAMRTVIPWAWDVMGVETAQSHIDEGNDPSVAVARALGATFDAKQTEIANAPGGEFHGGDGPLVNIWRHHKGALT
ncbi:GNAT family N-acetyltransferase [Octadecabacter sp. G9-8]|uniref:GNAT family N-acetyltransferase n=1 Tax=Octadecabacter dasysiphoniae TaxID=2909341 RepID=A0ABS9CVH4_9RHOB|nr:GNAT family N-acetyltransferase [Octadecabacter dasysiphoniae]MCF2871052.1 GNAT family N-acetyltransferase [Octadecabacter dasysiphoniae]